MKRCSNANRVGWVLLLMTVGVVAAADVSGIATPRRHLTRTLVDVLEQRIERAGVSDWDAITGLVVPGGNASRIEEAMRLVRLHPHLKLVLGGPGAHEERIAMNADGGLAPNITVERISLNTYGNAVVAKRLIEPRPGEKWLLVTSASHMPRALGSFHRVGFFVDPWPVHDSHGQNADALASIARHEWLGLLAYWVQGRTPSVFPRHQAKKLAVLS